MTVPRAVFAAVLLAVVLMANSAGITAAQGTGSIEIHKRVCPAGTAGNVFDECHDNAPGQPISFSLNGGAEQFVDAEGDLTFTGLAAGAYQISEVERIPLDFVTLQVYWSVQDADPEMFAVATDGSNFSVDLGEGEAIVCDVYNNPENLSGLTPTPAPAVTVDVTLPNTGRGVHSESRSPLPVGFALIAVIVGGLSVVASRRTVRNAGN